MRKVLNFLLKNDNKLKKITIVVIASILIYYLLLIGHVIGTRETTFAVNTKDSDGQAIRAYQREFYDRIMEQNTNIFLDVSDGGFYHSRPENWVDNDFFNGWGFYFGFESEVLMYKATGDPIYLNRAIDTADNIMLTRDDIRGVKNYNGELVPTWSGGSKYNFAKSIIKNLSGEDVLEVLVYGDWTVEDGRTGKRSNNADVKISVSEGTNADTFKIYLEDPTNPFSNGKSYIDENGDAINTYTLDNLTLDNGAVYDELGYVFSDECIKLSVLRSGAISPRDNPVMDLQPIGNLNADYIVGVGIITKPITDLIMIIREESLNNYYQEKADNYLRKLEETFQYHEKDWVEVDVDKGYYRIPPDAPQAPNGVMLPWNQQFEFLNTVLGLYEITGKSIYKERARKVVNNFMVNGVVYQSADDDYNWTYWGWEGHNANEKTRYAALDTSFLYRAYQNGLITNSDMKRFANTWRNNINDTWLSDNVDGRNSAEERRTDLGKVAFLAQWDITIFDKTVEWLEADVDFDNSNHHISYSVARIIYEKRVLDPDYVDETDTETLGTYRVLVNP